MQTLKEKLEIMLESENTGKEVQYLVGSGPDWRVIEIKDLVSETRIRIKPEKKRVPLTAEDLPPVFWVRDKTCTDWAMAVEVGSYGIRANLKYYPWDYLQRHEYVWSTDRKTEHPFWKEVEG